MTADVKYRRTTGLCFAVDRAVSQPSTTFDLYSCGLEFVSCVEQQHEPSDWAVLLADYMQHADSGSLTCVDAFYHITTYNGWTNNPYGKLMLLNRMNLAADWTPVVHVLGFALIADKKRALDLTYQTVRCWTNDATVLGVAGGTVCLLWGIIRMYAFAELKYIIIDAVQVMYDICGVTLGDVKCLDLTDPSVVSLFAMGLFAVKCVSWCATNGQTSRVWDVMNETLHDIKLNTAHLPRRVTDAFCMICGAVFGALCGGTGWNVTPKTRSLVSMAASY
jgi:hypothetical protein